MLTVAAWIRAAELRGTKLPAGHFTDPLDAPLAKIAERMQPAKDTVAAVFELAGFGGDSAHRATPEMLASSHLDILRKEGIAAALAALSNRKSA
jgi:fructuronate reductase